MLSSGDCERLNVGENFSWDKKCAEAFFKYLKGKGGEMMSSGDYEAANFGMGHCTGAVYHIEQDDYMGYSFVAKMLSDGWLALPTRSVGEPTKMISDGYRITKMVKEGDAIK